MTTVRDKRAIVTGGANGIGFQYCYHLLLNGAKTVVILDLPGGNGETSANKLNEEFGDERAIFIPSDVTQHKEFEVAFGKAVHVLGGLDILINNAGMLNDALWDKEIQVNFTSVVASTLLGYDTMGKHKGGEGGVVVNVSSIVGVYPTDIVPVYAATKHAVVAFTFNLKVHLEKTGVSVRVMCPGVTDTRLIAESQNKYLSFIDQEEAFKELSGYSRQSTENVGKAMIELIEKGANGAIWISQHGEPPVEIQFPKCTSVRLD